MKIRQLSILLCFLGTVSMSFSQSILNGSFEEWPDSCAWDVSPVSWESFNSSDRGPDQRGVFCDGTTAPYDGDNYMGLFGAAGFAIAQEGAQQQITGLTVGEMYTVSFYAIACDYTSYGIDLKVWAYIDSVAVFESGYLIKGEPWKHYQFAFMATETTADLAFWTSDFGYHCTLASIGIDFVSIHEGVNISENESAQLSVYPNPVTDVLFVEAPIGNNEPLEILDLGGKVILASVYPENGINVSNLEAGVYFVRFKNHPSKTNRFVKR